MTKETIQILEKQREDLVVRFLKKHEEAEANRFFIEKVLANISELLLVFDQENNLIQVNQEFLNKTGLQSPNDVSIQLDDLAEPTDARVIQGNFKNNTAEEFEFNLLTSHGSLPVKARSSTMINPEGETLYMLTCTDCSEFYELINRLQEGQKQLLHSSRLASLGEMTAGIGHELTQPLNAILLLARNCKKGLENPDKHLGMVNENLDIIIDRVNKASSIINTMRSFGRKVEEDLVPVDVNRLIEKTVAFLQSQLDLSEIRLDLGLGEQECCILGVDVRMEQVLLNLIQNSIQAMGNEIAPVLTITSDVADNVNPRTMQREPYVIIQIADNGAGIPEENIQKVFDPFFTTGTVGSGMGLGLSIVERILRSFSGYIGVESALGQGACFTISIPHHKPKHTGGERA